MITILQRKLNIYDFINRDLIPQPIIDINEKESETFLFIKELYDLRNKLRSRKCRIECKIKGNEKYRKLFLSLVQFYLYDYRSSKYYLKSIEKYEWNNEIQSLLLAIKYKMIKLEKVLFLISDDYSDKVEFYSLKRKYKKFIQIKNISKYSAESFKRAVMKFEQIFIFGHGSEKATYLGSTPLTPRFLEKILKIQNKKIGVLGIFSCQEKFNVDLIQCNVDYFITDRIQGVGVFCEMFAYGYFRNYFKTYSIIESFEMGKVVPVFRAVASPGFELYENGKPIRANEM